MYTSMLDASDGCGLDFGSLRVCITCGPAMPGDTRCRYEERFGCIVLEGYALSDPAPAARFNQPGKPRKVGSIGMPIKGVQMRVVDERGGDVPRGHPRRASGPRPQRDEGLLESARGNRGGNGYNTCSFALWRGTTRDAAPVGSVNPGGALGETCEDSQVCERPQRPTGTLVPQDIDSTISSDESDTRSALLRVSKARQLRKDRQDDDTREIRSRGDLRPAS